jgi:hypothetical protein|tara:strand:- start:865 stop:1611 length:747 start_codon:yes stop_codon:yes gene_type:complete
MAINMDKMKQKLESLQGNGNKKSAFWRPQDGEQVIRIVPTADGDPFKEYWFHYNLGNNPGFLSPKKNFGEDCPLDSYVRDLYRQGDEESIKMAKNLSARQRFFSPVVVRGEEDQGVRIWGFGKMAYQELLNLVLNPDYGDITDTEEGTDLVIKYGKPPGAQFPQTSITPRRKTTKLFDEDEKVSAALTQIPDFDSVFEKKSATEVQSMLDDFIASQLGDDDEVESASTESQKYGGDSIDSKFDELLQE